MSLKPGTSQTVTRTTGNGASLSGIGTVDKSVTKDPSTPFRVWKASTLTVHF